jgi:hypothetical protein
LSEEKKQALFDVESDSAFDSEKMESGVWIDYKGGSRLLIASTKRRKFQDLLDRQMAAYERGLRKGRKLDEAVSERIMADCLSRYVLLDWKGLCNKAGQEIPYSQAKAKDLLTRLEVFREDVFTFGQQEALFKEYDDEEALKNS